MKQILIIIIIILSIFIHNNSIRKEIISVGIFSEYGAYPSGWGNEYNEMLKILIEELDPFITVQLLYKQHIKPDVLNNFDVVIHPGGSGDSQSYSLGKSGRHFLKRFIFRGGGYVGICGGAYLAQYSNNNKFLSLRISQTKLVKDALHWERGGAIAKVRFTKNGLRYFPEYETKEFFMHYFQGPILVPVNSPRNKPAYETFMIFESDIYHKIAAAKGETHGKPFLLKEHFGSGRVVLMTGHPEFTPGHYWMVPRMIRLAAGASLYLYNDTFVTNKFTNEVMLTDEWIKKESYLLKVLESRISPWRKVQALKKLQRMHSVSVVLYFQELLLSRSVIVRKAVLEAIKYYDYFPMKYIVHEYCDNEKNWRFQNICKKVQDHFANNH